MPQPTYDAETLRKVALLAARMQSEQERLAPGQEITVEEMERIGEEVGLSPALMRQALGYLQAEDAAKVKAQRERKRQAILGLVACVLFAGTGAILGYKWYVNSAVMREGTGGRPLFEWPQVNVYFQRQGEPTLDQVMEITPGADRPVVTAPRPLFPAPPGHTSVPNSGVEAMDAAAIERYLDWVKRAESERAKLALRLVTYGQRMRNGIGGNTSQTRQLAGGPIKELQEFRTAVEQVHSEVPDPCRTAYYAYRSAIQRDTREAEGLANAFFRWRESDARKYGYDATRQVLQRYERPASELEGFMRAQNRSTDARIAVTEDTCLLRSLNFGLGNF